MYHLSDPRSLGSPGQSWFCVMQDDLNAVVQAFLEMKGDFKSRQEQVSRDTV